MESKPLKKQPKQKRSKEIVESVLEASTRILSKLRLKEVTTNAIAKAAGVGIGSLYDYFPNKDAIAVALIDKRVEELVDDFEKLLKSSPRSIDQLIDESLEFISTDFISRRDFLREIFFLAPASGRMEALYRARVRATHILQNHFMAQYQKDPDWAERKSFLLIHSLMGCLEGYVMIEDVQFDVEIFKFEMKKMMKAVLEL